VLWISMMTYRLSGWAVLASSRAGQLRCPRHLLIVSRVGQFWQVPEQVNFVVRGIC
jgi:hypothetical protein